MGEDEHDESPLERSDQEIGAEIAGDPETLLGALPHYYRGEVTQSTTSQDRINQTTN